MNVFKSHKTSLWHHFVYFRIQFWRFYISTNDHQLISFIIFMNLLQNFNKPYIICLLTWVKSYGGIAFTYAEEMTIFICCCNWFPPCWYCHVDEIHWDCATIGLVNLHMVCIIHIITGISQSYFGLHHGILSEERNHPSFFFII